MIAALLACWLYLGLHASIGESLASAPAAPIAEEAIDGADDWTEFDLSGIDAGEVQP